MITISQSILGLKHEIIQEILSELELNALFKYRHVFYLDEKNQNISRWLKSEIGVHSNNTDIPLGYPGQLVKVTVKTSNNCNAKFHVYTDLTDIGPSMPIDPPDVTVVLNNTDEGLVATNVNVFMNSNYKVYMELISGKVDNPIVILDTTIQQ